MQAALRDYEACGGDDGRGADRLADPDRAGRRGLFEDVDHRGIPAEIGGYAEKGAAKKGGCVSQIVDDGVPGMTQRTYYEVRIEQYEKWLMERDEQILELERQLAQTRKIANEDLDRHADSIGRLRERLEAMEKRIRDLQATHKLQIGKLTDVIRFCDAAIFGGPEAPTLDAAKRTIRQLQL